MRRLQGAISARRRSHGLGDIYPRPLLLNRRLSRRLIGPRLVRRDGRRELISRDGAPHAE